MVVDRPSARNTKRRRRGFDSTRRAIFIKSTWSIYKSAKNNVGAVTTAPRTTNKKCAVIRMKKYDTTGTAGWEARQGGGGWGVVTRDGRVSNMMDACDLVPAMLRWRPSMSTTS